MATLYNLFMDGPTMYARFLARYQELHPGSGQADAARALRTKSASTLNNWRLRGIPPARYPDAAKLIDVTVEELISDKPLPPLPGPPVIPNGDLSAALDAEVSDLISKLDEVLEKLNIYGSKRNEIHELVVKAAADAREAQAHFFDKYRGKRA